MYDTYRGVDGTEVQMKNGPCYLEVYEIGDKAPIRDGIYISYEGIIVIIDGKVAIVTDKIKDKRNESIEITPKMGQKIMDILWDINQE